MQKTFARRLRNRAVVTATILSFVHAQGAMAQLAPNDNNTQSPIKHVIIIIGENRTFDHVFATYVPRPGQTILNLMSEGIVTSTGAKGPLWGKTSNYGQPTQYTATDEQPSLYEISPPKGAAYTTLPAPGAAGAPNVASDTEGPPFATLYAAEQYEYGLYPGQLALITTGASGLTGETIDGNSVSATKVPDTRIANDANLPNGPFQLTGPHLPYDSYTGSPVHRFYQMWQQTDCSTSHATRLNPTGCLNDLFPWVETTVDTGSNGLSPTNDGEGGTGPYNENTYQAYEGATSMAFFNMAQGDVPYFKSLADSYTISDNFHQSVMGGTGANHIMFGYADAIYYTDYTVTTGAPVTPPTGQIENPNPQASTNNWYTNDGYGSTTTNDGGSYSNCYDTSQNGVAAVTTYLNSIGVGANCEQNAYYLLNNYNPFYVNYEASNEPSAVNGEFTIPPTYKHHIGDLLNENYISWAYYGESWDDYAQDPDPSTNPAGYLYCNICNPFQYSYNTMTNEQQVQTHIHDTLRLYEDLASGDLPAVSVVKPNALNDGHPASSKLDLFESFVHNIIADLQANKKLWAETAVFITEDEGGGYWDSGYVQPIDFFGDGTRIPLIVVSPFATGGHIVHTYEDHVSLDKFIERNWNIGKISGRSRDNLPNPTPTSGNPYVPSNRPAIGDLWDMFVFPQ
jgi:phospholipase C